MVLVYVSSVYISSTKTLRFVGITRGVKRRDIKKNQENVRQLLGSALPVGISTEIILARRDSTDVYSSYASLMHSDIVPRDSSICPNQRGKNQR
jgi:hypothetical protein